MQVTRMVPLLGSTVIHSYEWVIVLCLVQRKGDTSSSCIRSPCRTVIHPPLGLTHAGTPATTRPDQHSEPWFFESKPPTHHLGEGPS